MEEQSLIPYKKNEIAVISPPRKQIKRRKKRSGAILLRKILPVLAILLVAFAIYLNFPTIKDYIFTSSENEAIQNSEPTTDSSIKDNAPAHQYTFNSIIKSDYHATNESNLRIDFDTTEYISKNASQIYEKYGSGAPIVLIVNFSPKEAYSDGVGYSLSDHFYSESKNACEIGATLCNKLNENGIGAIHIDSYGHEGALVSGREMYISKINEVLKLYPSISYVLDISRDVDVNNDMNMTKETVSIDGETYAPIKLFCGTNDTGVSKNQKESIAFANDLAQYVNGKTSALITQLTVAKYDLALDFSAESVRLDIGSFANSYKEAESSVLLFADIFTSYLTQNEKPSN